MTKCGHFGVHMLSGSVHYMYLTSARLIDEREAQRIEVVAVRIPQAIGYTAAECVPAQAEVRDVHETGQFGRYLTGQIVVVVSRQ